MTAWKNDNGEKKLLKSTKYETNQQRREGKMEKRVAREGLLQYQECCGVTNADYHQGT